MAAVTYQLRQQTSLQPGPLYRVNNTVVSAVNSSPSVFVYKTETKAFSHYATVADLEKWPDSYDEAVTSGRDFYRQVDVQRDWKTTELMMEDLNVTVARLNKLAKELSVVQDGVIIDRTLTISQGT